MIIGAFLLLTAYFFHYQFKQDLKVEKITDETDGGFANAFDSSDDGTNVNWKQEGGIYDGDKIKGVPHGKGKFWFP